MGKIVDITDKLAFDENPCLVINGKKLEVNSDAPTMLKVMALMADGNASIKEIMDTYNLMFTTEAKSMIEEMHISFNDLITVVKEAVNLIVGDGDAGEQ